MKHNRIGRHVEMHDMVLGALILVLEVTVQPKHRKPLQMDLHPAKNSATEIVLAGIENGDDGIHWSVFRFVNLTPSRY